MNLNERVKKLRAESTDENAVEKLWEAIEMVATKADTASSDAVKKLNDSVRGLL